MKYRLFALSSFFYFVAIALSQYTTASLGGVVTDASGGGVPVASITVRNVETGLTKVLSTGVDGSFLFAALPTGTYDLTVEKNGFSKYVQQGIILTVNQSATQAVTLQVGSSAQQISVHADASMVTVETSAVGQLVSQKQVLELPLNGRAAQSLLFLAPGTIDTTSNYAVGVYPNSPRDEQQAAVNGGGPGNVNYQMDGTGHNDTYLNMNLPFPNPDAIQEFNLQSSNMSAEYGNAQNVVNIVTKSGTNSFHGSAFEFVRNGNLNARNFFAPSPDTLKRNQFGGALGGPVRKNSLFFFGTYQGTRIRQTAAGQISFVPTPAQRSGNFSGDAQLKDPVTGVLIPGNLIPQSQITAPSQFFLKGIPLPNGPGGMLTYPGPPFVQDRDEFMPKVDYLRGRNQLNVRYSNMNYNEPADLEAAKVNLLAMNPNANQVRVQTVAVNETFTATPRLLFATYFGWDRQAGAALSGAPYSFADAGVKIASSKIPSMNNLNVSGYFVLSGKQYGAFNRGDDTFREVMTFTRGSHELRMGGEAVRLNMSIVNTISQGGQFVFSQKLSGSNLADFLLGRASTFTQGGGQYQESVGTLWSFFVQDNWKISRNFSLQPGLRWDPFWPYTETKNRVVCFRPGMKSQAYPNAPLGMVFGGDSGCPAGTGTESSLGNLSPRLGFAYGIRQKMSIRGGVGIYHDAAPTNQFNGFGSSAPFAPRFTFTNVSFVDPYASLGIANPFPAQFGGGPLPPSSTPFTLPASITETLPSNWKVASIVTWNLTVERQIGNNLLISVAYLGNGGYHLSSGQKGGVQLDPAIYIPGASTQANTQQRRLYPDFSSIVAASPDRNSHYQALQLDVKKRLARGLSLWANYTWSHMMDNYPIGGGGGVSTNPFNRNFDWGNAADNVPNVFHLSGVWELPKARARGFAGALINGWELSGILTRQTGFPFTLTSGIDNSFSSVGNDRAQFIGTDLSQARLDTSRSHAALITRYFNIALFALNPVGTFGNTGKDILTGPRFFNTDMGLSKRTRVTEAVSVQFRAEFFNAFNVVNFGRPGSSVSSGATFGRITSAGDPRILQLALKLMF